MVWTGFKNERRENPKKGFEYENKWKMSKRKTGMKMGTGEERCPKEERTWKTNEEEEFREDKNRLRALAVIRPI
jgi:hypothetical protein